MFLNANTATRRVRELRYDMLVLLQTFRDMRISSSDDIDWVAMLEACWADGSIDVIPLFWLFRSMSETYEPALGIFCHRFESLMISSAGLVPWTAEPDADNYYNGPALFIRGAALSAHLQQVGDATTNISITNSRITKLTASTVSLPPTARIRGIGNRDVNSKTCEIKSLQHADKVLSRDCVIDEFDVHGVRLTTDIRYPATRIDASCLETMSYSSGNPKVAGFMLTGMVRLADTDSTIVKETVAQNGTVVSVDIPVKIAGGYRYVLSAGTPVPQDVTTALVAESDANIVLLYPFVQVTGYAGLRDVRIHLDIPTSDMDGRVVQVSNAKEYPLKVCNAWMFGLTGSVGKAYPLNYVTMPAYSTIDFVFRYDDGGSFLRAYMLPMLRG